MNELRLKEDGGEDKKKGEGEMRGRLLNPRHHRRSDLPRHYQSAPRTMSEPPTPMSIRKKGRRRDEEEEESDLVETWYISE